MAINIIQVDNCTTEIKEGEIVDLFIKPVGSDDYMPVSEYAKKLKGPIMYMDASKLK